MSENEANIHAESHQNLISKLFQHKSGKKYMVIGVRPQRRNDDKYEVRILARRIEENLANTTLTEEISFFLNTFKELPSEN